MITNPLSLKTKFIYTFSSTTIGYGNENIVIVTVY